MEDLIADYLQQVESCLAIFEAKFGRRDLIRAWREGILPPTGELADGVKFHIHGVGCSVEKSDYDIDFDFATRDEVGFDAWRLWRFAKQFPTRYPDYQERSAVEAGLDNIVMSNMAARVPVTHPGETNSKLFKLTSER